MLLDPSGSSPKQSICDVVNIAELTAEDVPYVLGCLALVRELVSQDKMESYSLQTNDPAQQKIDYLHFHLEAKCACSVVSPRKSIRVLHGQSG